MAAPTRTPTPPGHRSGGTDSTATIASSEYKSKAPTSLKRPSTPEALGRGSFSSVRENDDGKTQTFTSSKFSSYASHFEEAVDDSSSVDVEMSTTEVIEFVPPVTQPFSRLHGTWFPANSFRGWKQINVQGRTKTRSFGDLQTLNMMWTTPAPRPARGSTRYAPGASPVEKLPLEILGAIIDLLVVDIPPPNGITTRNSDLMALLLGSRTLHAATLNTLYRHITVPHSRIYKKFLNTITEYPSLGTLVRRLDFSHFNPTRLFTTNEERMKTQNLTAQTLLEAFDLTPHLQEILAQEHVEDDLNEAVLRKIFTGMPKLQAVDLCGCSSATFRDSFSATLLSAWPASLSITRLSLHKCFSLTPAVLETLLPRLTRVTHLDLAGTKVSDAALRSIPPTACITHLNLAKCHYLTAPAVIEFLTTHPAVANSLVFVSVAMDARSHQIFDIEDVNALIPRLPPTLKSLSLKGSKMDALSVKLLVPLTRHLEELAVGRCLTVQHLRPILDTAEGQAPHTLHYIDLSDLTSEEMDLASLFNNSPLLKASSAPLQVVEITETIFQRLSKAPQIPQRAGWAVREFGHRAWLVRDKNHTDHRQDNGQRAWKMGAESWGMRKIPVAKADVGGMYGSFMFGRKL